METCFSCSVNAWGWFFYYDERNSRRLLVSVKITDNKRLWDNLKQELKATGSKEVVTGIQKGR